MARKEFKIFVTTFNLALNQLLLHCICKNTDLPKRTYKIVKLKIFCSETIKQKSKKKINNQN